MSTRRNLRSGSQAAGSGASPTPTNTGDIPATPGGRRTSRRAGNQPLPAIGLRTSTAYGSNSIAVPPRAATAQPNIDVANALQGLMQPSTRPAATSSRARPTSRGNTRTPTIRSALRNSQTPGGQSNAAASTPERSFNQEEDIFGRAGIESSPPDDNDLSNILEEPEDIDSDDDDIPIPDPNQVQMEQLREIARQNIDRAVAARDAATMGIEPPHVKAARFARRVRDFVVNFFQDPPWLAWRIILPVVITLLLATTVPYVSKIIPIGNPLSRIPNFYAPQDAVEIRDSLRHVESDIMQIKKQIERVNFDTVRELQKMLPDLVSVKRKKGGKVEIPKDIWEAIHAKIQSDDSLTSEPSSGKVSSGSGLSKKEVNKIFEAKWKSFLDENEGKVGKMMDSDFTSRFPKMLEENDVVRRADIIDMINDSWKDNSAKLTNEMEHLSKKFERLNREVTKVQQGSSKMSKDELKALAAEVSKHMPSTQLKATAKHNMEMSFNHGAQGANHFNINLGAAIQPEFTSPTWVPTEMPLFPMRIVHTLLHNPPPIQHGPIAALRRWEEYGDCWCAATTDKKGSPLSLHVLLGASIWPEQIIVEHLPMDESYESGSVPKDMELLAYIPDFKQLDAVREYSASIFKDGDEHSKIPAQYVKIGTWQYDAEIPQNVQPFRIQVNLKDLGVHTNKVIVRSKNNWGGEKVPYTCLYRVRLHGGIAARTPLA